MGLIRRNTTPIAFVLAGVFALATAVHGDTRASSGKRQYAKCAACHSLQPGVHLMGPSLASLEGRKAGSVDGFLFSAAMESSDIVWDQDSLSAFLANPSEFMPGMVMPFGGLRDETQRNALVEFLLSGSVQNTPTKHPSRGEQESH